MESEEQRQDTGKQSQVLGTSGGKEKFDRAGGELTVQMRTIDQIARLIRDKDPETALTKTAIRRLVVTGAVPSVRVGQKYLVSLEAVDNYLAGVAHIPVSAKALSGGIRPVEV